MRATRPLQLGSRRGRRRLKSVLGEKLVLGSSVVPGQRTLGCLQGHLAHPGIVCRAVSSDSSVLALLLRDGAYAQGCKDGCYGRCHFRFDR